MPKCKLRTGCTRALPHAEMHTLEICNVECRLPLLCFAFAFVLLLILPCFAFVDVCFAFASAFALLLLLPCLTFVFICRAFAIAVLPVVGVVLVGCK